MRYLGASAAVLVAAMMICLTTRASDGKPVVRSGMDRNTILPLSPRSSDTITITRDIERYGGTEGKPTLLEMLVEFDHITCIQTSEGAWTYKSDQLCGKEKCGEITTGTVTGQFPSGDHCGGINYTFKAIFYKWTAHNNQSTLSAPPDKVADTFDAAWTLLPENPNSYQYEYKFNISVPVVRPDHETTVFERWSPDIPTAGEWKQKLVPPKSDPTFDFSGETVMETAAMGVPGDDSCWFKGSQKHIVLSITGGIWPVESGNVWKPDQVGWKPDYVTYYRSPDPLPPPAPPGPLPSRVPCGFTIQQQMTIKAPSDGITFNNYGPVNVLEGKITQKEVTSERAGKSKTKKWP